MIRYAVIALLLTSCVPDAYDISQYGAHVPAFGEPGVSDDAAAVNAALAAAATDGQGEWVAPRRHYRIDSQLTWDISRVGINWNGSTVDFSNMTNGTAMLCHTTDSDPNHQPLSHVVHPIRNGIFLGPSKGAGVVGLRFLPPGNWMSTIGLENCGFAGFDTAVSLGTGCFCVSFRRVNFGSTGGRACGRGVLIEVGSVNAGERITFSDCQFYNIFGTAFESLGAPSGSVSFTGCSMDYCWSFIKSSVSQSVSFQGGHLEGGGDDDFWIQSMGFSTRIVIRDSQWNITGSRTKPLGFTDSASGGINLSGNHICFAPEAAFSAPHLIGGPGRIVARDNTYDHWSIRPPYSDHVNAP